ncbi:MAG: hypothetical protein ACE5J7_04565 [Candidatus Aenigmatarchaeota archaeon]
MKKQEISVILAYTLITVVMLLPFGITPGHIAGVVEGDVFNSIWPFWWMAKSINLGTNYIFTDYIFYPNGTNLAFYPFALIDTLMFLPITLMFGTVISYNFSLFMSFLLSAIGMFYLSRYITKDTKASFVAGLIFSFSSYHLLQATGHMYISTMQWIPFFILFFLKALKEKKNIYIALAAVFLLFNSLATWEYALHLLLFTSLYVLADFFVKKRNHLKILVKILVVYFIIAAPVLFPVISEYIANPYERTIEGSVVASMDILSYVTPTKYHLLYGNNIGALRESMLIGKPVESTAFLGFTVIILLLFSLRKRWKELASWTLALITLFIFSLGPVLQIGGRLLFKFPLNLADLAMKLGIRISELGAELLNNFIGVPLPYLLLYLYFPFFSVLRSPSRFLSVLTLIIALFCAFSVKELNKKYKKAWIVISVLVLLESFVILTPLISSEVPQIYHEIAKEEGDFAIMEAPFYAHSKFMFYQTVHGKKIVGGSWWRYAEASSFHNNNSLLTYLRFNITPREAGHELLLERVKRTNPEAADILDKYIEARADIYKSEQFELTRQPTEADVKEFIEYKIKYIIIFPEEMPQDVDINPVLEYLGLLIGRECESKHGVYLCRIY